MQAKIEHDIAGRLYLIAALVLIAGFAGSALIFLTAQEDPGNVLGYVLVDGQAYPIRPEDSKMYRHDLELYGGKLNVVMDEFLRGFAGLWRGKTLAFTIAGITVLISLVLFLAARHVRLLAARADVPEDTA